MSYIYDEETNKVSRVNPPKLNKKESEKILKAKVPKKFLKKIMSMKLKIG